MDKNNNDAQIKAHLFGSAAALTFHPNAPFFGIVIIDSIA